MTFLRLWNSPGGGGGGPQLVPSGGSTVWTEKCPHDVVGLRPHKGTMWMSNDRVPLENVESPYGVSSIPGAAGDLLPVMFPVAPVLLAGGPQLGFWQVAVLQGILPDGNNLLLNKIGIGRLTYLSYQTGFGHTVVEGGPVGPEVIEPLELLVLDHADLAYQHAVIRDTTRLLEHPLTQSDSSLGDRLVEKISDWEPAGTSGSGHYPGRST